MKKNVFLFIAVLCSTVLLAQPSNDNVCDAISLTLDADCSGTLPYTTIAATVESGEDPGSCYGEGSVEQTVWFSFVAPSTGAVSIDTDFSGSGIQDNQLTVFEYDADQTFDCTVLANYVEVACNEDKLPAAVNTDFNAALPPISVTAGSTYYIQVDGFNAGDEMTPDISEGTFCIVVTTVTPPSNDDCGTAAGYGGFGPSCTKIWGDNLPNPESATTIGATAGNSIDVLSCDGTGLNATVYYTFLSGVEEVEFNLLTGENINVTLFSDVESCDDADDGSVELTNNCFTDIDASANTNPDLGDLLFTDLSIGTSYLMAIWTNEGEETDFSFCLVRAPNYECGDNECYTLAESYTNCESDCPCISSMDFVSLTAGAVSTAPEGVCAEIIGGSSDSANPGIYIPFQINTLDSDLTGSLVSATQGSIFTSSSNLNFFGYATNPLIPLPNNEYDGNINFLFLTQSEIDAGGTITISFTSDNGACSASIELNLADLTGANSNECGNCNLSVSPVFPPTCPDFNTSLDIEGAVGDLWLSQNGSTIFDPGDIPIPYAGGYPSSDFTLTIYDSGQPNCAFPLTLTFGDYFCPEVATDPIGTFCRLEPTVDTNSTAICDDATGNVLVPISFGNTVTGVLTSNPDIITGSGPQGPYYASVDANNCSPINVTVMDESAVDAFSGTPIFNIISPASIAGGNANVGTNSDDWGVDIETLGTCTTGGVSGTVVLVNDGSENPTEFCTAPAQCAELTGNIALIDRGSCNFTAKVANAEQCCAIAVIICNNNTADPDEVFQMGAGAAPPTITIPAIMISFNDCQPIKVELGNSIEACIGAPETVAGCERTFTVDVCADYSVTTCDDNDCSTENDVATVGPDGAEICACAGTPITCPAGQMFNTETCMCESDVIAGCTDNCADNFDPAAQVDDGSCNPYDDTCNQDCTLGPFGGTWDAATCSCINENEPVNGCTDNTACNYNPNACVDDGSCTDIPAGACDCAGTLPATWYADNDGDGLGDPNNSIESCEQPAGFVSNSNDDNDGCDGILDECGVCNGSGIAAGTCDCAGTLPATWYADNDGDGLGDPNNSTESCEQPAGFVDNANDDNDTCSGVLDECGVCNGTGIVAGTCDCAGNLPITWYADNDGDGFGDPNNSTESCDQPAGFVSNSNDADDTNPDASTDIPTLSQWGLILLSLILLSISTVSAMQKKYSLAYNVRAANSSATIPYFNKNLFKQMLMKSIPLMLFIFVLISFLEGGWFVRNLVGSILSIGVCVYVLHFIELSKQFDEGNH